MGIEVDHRNITGGDGHGRHFLRRLRTIVV
jgi:hypothetical protein